MVVWGLGLGLGLVHISYIITFCQSCILQLGNARAETGCILESPEDYNQHVCEDDTQ